MKTDFDIRELNEEIIDIYIEPHESRIVEDPPFLNMTALNFTWEPFSYDLDELIIKLTFNDYVYIS